MKKGFTLIELLLYVSISATILLVISSFLGIILQGDAKNRTISEVEGQGMQVMQLITQTIRNAQSINAPEQGLQAPTSSIDVVNLADDPTLFDIASGAIRITEGAAAAVPLTNSRVTASDLSFSNYTRSSTSGTLRIEFTLSHVNNEGRNEFSFTKTFYGSASVR
jgi:Tfp pilus assembly protein PilW